MFTSFATAPLERLTRWTKSWSRTCAPMIGPIDRLWIVGDFSCSRKASDRIYLERIFEPLPGAEKHLIIGNHDLKPTLALAWASKSSYTELRDGPRTTHTQFHYQMIPWNHARRRALQLFGHVHNNLARPCNYVKVSVDIWDCAPVQLEAIIERAEKLNPNLHWDDIELGLAKA